MVTTLEQLSSKALSLPKDQRYTLVNRILSSMEPSVKKSVSKAWDTEIQKRIASYDAGKSKGIPANKVFRKLKQKLSK